MSEDLGFSMRDSIWDLLITGKKQITSYRRVRLMCCNDAGTNFSLLYNRI